MSTKDEVKPVAHVKHFMRELLLGRQDPEEFFCLSLSLLGHQYTQEQFLDLIEPLAEGHEELHTCLVTIFLDYFTKVQSGKGVEEEELELALTLSMQEMREGELAAQGPLSHAQRLSYAQRAIRGGRVAQKNGNSHCSRAPVPCDMEQAQRERCTEGLIGKITNIQNESVCVTGTEVRYPSLSRSDEDVPVGINSSQDEKSKRSRRRRQRKRQQLAMSLSPSSPRPVLLWFRRDLRLNDNPALIGSLEVGGPVIPVFLWCPEEEEGPGVTVAVGGASKYWLHHALLSLNHSLERLGSHLVTVKVETSSQEALQRLVTDTGAGTLLATALYEPWLKERDDLVFTALQRQGVKCQLYHSYCLRDPNSVSTEGVGLRGIGSVSHFMSCCQQNPGPGLGTPVDAPLCLPVPSAWPQGCHLSQLALARMPRRKDGTVVDWATNIRSSWDFSEEGAQARLQAFLRDGIYRYEKESCRADAPNTSSLSPYLHYGQISPRSLLSESRSARCRPPKFQRKLAWRDLAYWQLTLFPDLPWESLRPPYKALRWSSDRAHLKAWQRGRTGYPLVDASMRQLWLTGWMNNYMRHVVASFLIAYLHLPWQEGYRWFQDTLVDADVAIDAMMWQNGGMCGLDHWNFVMHPVCAALTCDPCGSFVRKWCPELAELPDEFIHKPWQCPTSLLRRAGVVLGQNYPERIVTDLEERRAQSLQDVAVVRRQFGQYVDRHSGCDLIPLPDRLVKEALGRGDIVQSGSRFLLPVITRMEFKHQAHDTDAKSNPFDAVLKGYVSRKRDETIAFLNERDFTASVLSENAQRRDRQERDQRALEGLPHPPAAHSRARRTPSKDIFSVVPAGVTVRHK
ncbi:hypothetical protein MATL_G00097210 [Megalops atlanticus]|uniref:Photolyase/cryptochrome alpha/beta domain-containing protein n=1 Tax=Megalops atlanticus TaxID=7932 RepID=A0A9D3Q3R8_MEGAT|nr:hypothetical protein MATL_G00097210 [Megalops atlanticus]